MKVVTVSNDAQARVWRVAVVVDLTVLRGHTDTITSAVFSTDGKWVVTASGYDGSAKTWPLEIDLLRDLLWQATSYCLSPAERVRRLGETAEEARTRAEEARTNHGIQVARLEARAVTAAAVEPRVVLLGGAHPVDREMLVPALVLDPG